jgi:hypothetical protein
MTQKDRVTTLGDFSYISLASPAGKGLYAHSFPHTDDFVRVLQEMDKFTKDHPDLRVVSFHEDKFVRKGLGHDEHLIHGIYVQTESYMPKVSMRDC